MTLLGTRMCVMTLERSFNMGKNILYILFMAEIKIRETHQKLRNSTISREIFRLSLASGNLN